MNPYNRFSLVSSSVTAALILCIIALGAGPAFEAISNIEASGTTWALMTAGAVTVMVVFWMAFTEVILPTLFRLNWVRELILGRYYVEGTWLQAEKSDDSAHIAVIDIQPDGKSFTFSGYALDENLDVNSNVLIELSKFEWPFLTFKYRNSLSDGADGQREGVGEVQFEMNRSAARRYNGFSQYIKNDTRTRLEGAKLVRNSDVKRLRTLEGREEIIDTYWNLFFGRKARRAEQAAQARATTIAPVAAPVQSEPVAEAEPVRTVEQIKEPVAEAPAADDRRKSDDQRPADLEEQVIPRRRSSDWVGNEETAAEVEETAPEASTESETDQDGEPAGRRFANGRYLDKRHMM